MGAREIHEDRGQRRIEEEHEAITRDDAARRELLGERVHLPRDLCVRVVLIALARDDEIALGVRGDRGSEHRVDGTRGLVAWERRALHGLHVVTLARVPVR